MSTGWKPPSRERAAMMVHPQARTALRDFLLDDERMRGVGYSEFVMAGIAALKRELDATGRETE